MSGNIQKRAQAKICCSRPYCVHHLCYRLTPAIFGYFLAYQMVVYHVSGFNNESPTKGCLLNNYALVGTSRQQDFCRFSIKADRRRDIILDLLLYIRSRRIGGAISFSIYCFIFDQGGSEARYHSRSTALYSIKADRRRDIILDLLLYIRSRRIGGAISFSIYCLIFDQGGGGAISFSIYCFIFDQGGSEARYHSRSTALYSIKADRRRDIILDLLLYILSRRIGGAISFSIYCFIFDQGGSEARYHSRSAALYSIKADRRRDIILDLLLYIRSRRIRGAISFSIYCFIFDQGGSEARYHSRSTALYSIKADRRRDIILDLLLYILSRRIGGAISFSIYCFIFDQGGSEARYHSRSTALYSIKADRRRDIILDLLLYILSRRIGGAISFSIYCFIFDQGGSEARYHSRSTALYSIKADRRRDIILDLLLYIRSRRIGGAISFSIYCFIFYQGGSEARYHSRSTALYSIKADRRRDIILDLLLYIRFDLVKRNDVKDRHNV